jgi:hypothetical protein
MGVSESVNTDIESAILESVSTDNIECNFFVGRARTLPRSENDRLGNFSLGRKTA